MAKKKSLSVTIENPKEKIKTYDYFLMKIDEDALRIDFAEISNENDDKIDVFVKQSVAISADRMLKFCGDVILALSEYESKYKNGKGINFEELLSE